MAFIVTHKTPISADPNNGIDLEAVTRGVGGAPIEYRVSLTSGPLQQEFTLRFRTLQQEGITNELLLAIVQDRLSGFQAGPCACEENTKAMEHVTQALHELKNRTARRDNAGVGGTMGETKAAETVKTDPKHRVRTEGFKLIVGNAMFDVDDDLKTWSAWNSVERACKALSPDISPLELEVIAGVAARCNCNAANNGFAELKSALASTRKP